MATENYLINPRHRRKKKSRRKIRRNPLMLIGNPKHRRKIKRHRKLSLPKKIRIELSNPKTGLTKRRKTMARRKSHKKYGRHNPHHLVVTGRKGHVRISTRSRLAPHSRGRWLNPNIIKNIPFMDIGFLAVGGIISRALPTYLPLPAQFKTGIYRIGIQAVSSVVLGEYVVGKMLKKPRIGRLIMLGGLVSTAITILDAYVLKGKLAEGDMSVYLPSSGMMYYPQLSASPSEYVHAGEDEEVLDAGGDLDEEEAI